MLGLSSSLRSAVARSCSGASSNAPSSAAVARALSTTATESLKVTSAPPPSAAAPKEERIKYFKIYRWDPDHRQKPVSFELM